MSTFLMLFAQNFWLKLEIAVNPLPNLCTSSKSKYVDVTSSSVKEHP